MSKHFINSHYFSLMSLYIALGVILLSSIVIYFAGEKFAESSSKIGDHLGLPRDVKGVTFDAISSSLPELMVALYSVILFKQFEVGIGTIAGSAMFNLLIIPGICVFFAPVAFQVSKKVISRDGVFYLFSVIVLLLFLLNFNTWGLMISIILLLIYLVYALIIVKDVKDHKKLDIKAFHENVSIWKETGMFFVLLIIIGLFTFFLTDYSIVLSHLLGVPSVVIAFTITAAATSIPDTVISVVNAKKGDIDDAASNVFGSNIFDILIGIGLPLMIYYIFKGDVEILFTNLEVIVGLMISTIIVLLFFGKTRSLNKIHASILLLMYFCFFVYTVSLAF